MDPTINHLNQLVQRIEDLSEELQICDDIIATLFEDLYNEFLELSESTDMKDNKTKAGKKMPEKDLEKAAKGKGKKGERAYLAMKLKKYSKYKKDLKEATELAAEHEYLTGMLNQKDIQPQKAEAIKARLKQIEGQVTPQSGGKYFTNTIAGEY
jgi:hypothetical protein